MCLQLKPVNVMELVSYLSRTAMVQYTLSINVVHKMQTKSLQNCTPHDKMVLQRIAYTFVILTGLVLMFLIRIKLI